MPEQSALAVTNAEQLAAWLTSRGALEDRHANSALAQIPTERMHATKRFLEQEAAQHRDNAKKFRAAASLLSVAAERDSLVFVGRVLYPNRLDLPSSFDGLLVEVRPRREKVDG